MNTLSITDLNTTIDAEPRILDVTLGERLGMAQPRNLRSKINANRSELSSYGKVCTVSVQTPECKGGRPSKAFYLNEPQAILLCMFANTPLAAEVRHQVITVFMAYRRGGVQVKAHERRTSTPVDQAVRLRTNIDRLEQAVAAMSGQSATATVSEMLRRFEEDEIEHAKLRSVRIAAMRDVIRNGVKPGKPVQGKKHYAETIPTLILAGKSPRDIMRATGATRPTVSRYRMLTLG